jgi:hypothetical protein
MTLLRPGLESMEPLAQDELSARRVLQRAQGALQKWPEGFAGFSAAIRCREGQEEAVGDVRVFAGGRVDLGLGHARLSDWARASLGAISLARTPRFFKDGDGAFPIAFGPADGHQLGRGVRVRLGGDAWRAYRIDAKGRIRQEESAAPTKRVTATYDGFFRTCPGRVLPACSQIFEWDVVTQRVTETAAIEDAYERRNHVWLPVGRRAIVTQDLVRRELVFELSRHILL